MTPDREKLLPRIYREIVFGSTAHASLSYRSGGYKLSNAIELPFEGDKESPDWEKQQRDFAEACFEHTALDEDWLKQGKKCVSVGDVIAIADGSDWYCAPTSWEKL